MSSVCNYVTSSGEVVSYNYDSLAGVPYVRRFVAQVLGPRANPEKTPKPAVQSKFI